MFEPASKSMPAIDYVSMVRAVYGDRRATLMATLSSAIASGAAAFKTGHWALWAVTAVFILIFMDLVEVPAIFFLGIWFQMQLFSGVGSIGTSNRPGLLASLAGRPAHRYPVSTATGSHFSIKSNSNTWPSQRRCCRW